MSAVENSISGPAQGLQEAKKPVDLKDPVLYLNRELSLLEFQRRVLDEAADPGNPLLERVKFLAIVSSNLDEFFMVRVAGLLQQVASGATELGMDGRSPIAQLALIGEQVRGISRAAHDLYSNELRPALAQHGIRILDYAALNEEQKTWADSYFARHVFPVLTPLAFDPGRPFPHISSRSLNLAVVVAERGGPEHFARVKIPDTLAQLVALPAPPGGAASFVWLEQLIAANLRLLFSGLDVVESYPFRVIRDAEVAIQELESDDLLETVEEAMRKRRFSAVVRLQVDAQMPERILEILTGNLELDPEKVYHIPSPIGLARLMELHSLDRPELKDKSFLGYVPAGLSSRGEENLFEQIRREEVLLHHPFDSFQPVVEFLQAAAEDPDVLAIKMTLYRVGRNSPIVAALLKAVENGKQVAALVELKARFDEESNIEWARTLEDAGVHVVYGMVGFKVHSKITLVIRRECGAIRGYVHLGTGNYNPATARSYTDFGWFTCNQEIADDATYFFNALTGYSRQHKPHKLLVAPVNLRERLEFLIGREIAVRESGAEGHIILKMNQLEDPEMIRSLYRASQAGVKIDLLVRGFCCLRPGVPGVSENIRVTSIIGRFLEHSRVFYFHNGGAEEIYLGSADLMRRNLSHRYEIAFPIENPKLVRRLKDTLDVYLADTAKGRHLQADGLYVRPPKENGKNALDSQMWLLTHHQNNNRSPLSLWRRRGKNGSS